MSTLATYGAIIIIALSTTVGVSAGESSFAILFPDPPNTAPVEYTTLLVPPSVSAESTYTPIVAPILVLTKVIGIAVDSNGSPLATGTLTQPPPLYTNTAPSLPAPLNCTAWSCWSVNRQVGVSIAIAIAALILIVILWHTFCWHSIRARIHLKRKKLKPEPDVELAGSPLRYRVSSRPISVRKSRESRRKQESRTPSPLSSTSIEVSEKRGPGLIEEKKPPAFRVVRQPSVRDYQVPVKMPEPPSQPVSGRSDEGTRRDDYVLPAVTAAAAGAGAGTAFGGSRRGSIREGRDLPESIPTSRRGSVRPNEIPTRFRRRAASEDRQENQSRSLRGRSERYVEDGYDYGGEREREAGGRGEEEDEMRRRRRSYVPRDDEIFESKRESGSGRRRSHSYKPRDEEISESRRDSSPGGRRSDHGRERRRHRSTSPSQRDRRNEKPRERRNSDEGDKKKRNLAKYLPLLPLAFGILHTFAEPTGGWSQYIPEDKRKKETKDKAKDKLREKAEEVFDKHHKKIPVDFHKPSAYRAHRFSRSHRSHSVDRSYDSTRDHRRARGRSEHESRRSKYSSDRPTFDSMKPETGRRSADSLSRSPLGRRRSERRGHRERGGMGYDGADDGEYGYVYGDSEEKVAWPYEVEEAGSVVSYGSEPRSQQFLSGRGGGSATFPRMHGAQQRQKHMPPPDGPPTPPVSVD